MTPPFIRPNEFILLMDDPNLRDASGASALTRDDLCRFREAGIQTVVRYPYWREIETLPGHCEWGAVDRWLDEARSADMKTMLAVYDLPPHWTPDAWCLKDLHGQVYRGPFYDRIIVPWAKEGWDYHLYFIWRMCRRYNAPDVLCFRSTVHGGEVVLPEGKEPDLAGHDLRQTVEAMVYDEQAIFSVSHPSHEVWMALHHAFDSQPWTGNTMKDELYLGIKERFPETHLYGLSYTQFYPGVIGERENQADIARLGLGLWAGSEHCQGLQRFTEQAIEEGFRGFLCGALHFLSGYRVSQPWMFQAVRESDRKWRESRGLS